LHEFFMNKQAYWHDRLMHLFVSRKLRWYLTWLWWTDGLVVKYTILILEGFVLILVSSFLLWRMKQFVMHCFFAFQEWLCLVTASFCIRWLILY
jgi:hypothetical protein